MTSLGRGLVAGACGTLLLDAATYVDMAVTGRQASTTPGETVRRTAKVLGQDPPADPPRLEAYGALGGMSVGLGLGVVASLLRSAGVRVPAPVGAAGIGALAMAASDGSMTALGVSDPREWSRADWTRDVVPHLAYGVGVRWAMDRMDSRRAAPMLVTQDEVTPARRSRARVLTRCAALGLATGSRSSLALAGPVLSGRGGGAGVLTAGLVASELVVDKIPGMPDRTAPGPFLARVAGGALGGTALARRHELGRAGTALGAAAGAVGASAGALAGVVWREVAGRRGWTWQAGAAEDAAALAMTVAACR